MESHCQAPHLGGSCRLSALWRQSRVCGESQGQETNTPKVSGGRERSSQPGEATEGYATALWVPTERDSLAPE